MSFRATALKRKPLSAFFLILLSLPLLAQADKKPVTNVTFVNESAITTSFIKSPPSLSSTTNGNSVNDAQWLKVEFHYSVLPTVPDANYLDSAQFKIWIEGRDLLAPNAPGSDGVAVALVGSVTYVNIPVGKDLYGVFYVHPNTLGRYSSKSGISDFDRRFNIHMEASVNGAYSDNIDKTKETDKAWFSALPVITGLVYRQDQSPFVTTDIDRYPATKMIASPGDAAAGAP